MLILLLSAHWMVWEFKSAVVVTLCSPQHDREVCIYPVVTILCLNMIPWFLELFTILACKRDRV